VRGIHGLTSPMVGRDSEIKALSQLCEAVRAGLGRAVIIVGEPGLGKTRLVSEWKAIVKAEPLENPPIWAEGRGLSFGQGIAYHLLKDLIRSVLGIPGACEEAEANAIIIERTRSLFGDSMMEIYPFIANLLSIDMDADAEELVNLPDPQALRTQYYRAVRRLLVALSERQPIVLVLEDLHWADASSIDLLVRLLPLVTTGSILMSLVTRDDRDSQGWRLVNSARELMGGSLLELSLAPLTDIDSRKMIANLLDVESLPDKVRKIILEKAEGNPLFVEEVIRMLIERNAITRENGGWIVGKEIYNIEIPDNLQGLLSARIDRLPEDVKQILRVASVIGRKFPVQVLEQVLKERLTVQALACSRGCLRISLRSGSRRTSFVGW